MDDPDTKIKETHGKLKRSTNGPTEKPGDNLGVHKGYSKDIKTYFYIFFLAFHPFGLSTGCYIRHIIT
jgi:hypothetical protein